MAHCYGIGIAFFPHFAGPLAKALARRMMERWLRCQEAVQWSQNPPAFAKCTHALRCWFACDVSVRYLFQCGLWAQVSMRYAEDPSVWIWYSLAGVRCMTQTSVSCLSHMTSTLPVTCENFQKGTRKEASSQQKVLDHGSWIFTSSVKMCDCGKTWPKTLTFFGLYPAKVKRFRGIPSSG